MANPSPTIPVIMHGRSQEAREASEENYPRSENASVHGPMGVPGRSERHDQSPSHANAPASDANAPPVDTNVLLAQALQQLTQQLASSGSGRAKSSGYSDFLSLKPPTFEGSTNPAEAKEWLDKIERIFQIMRRDISEDEKVDLATFMLQGEALEWWQAIQLRNVEGRVWIWDMFKSEFLEKYFPRAIRLQYQRQFLDLRQGERTVREFEREFNRLAPFAPEIVRDEESKTEFFIQGLQPNVRRFVHSGQVNTFVKAVELALRIEQDFAESRATQTPKSNVGSSKRKRNPEGQQPFLNENEGKISLREFKPRILQCGKCGGNHLRAECKFEDRVCFRCQKPSHMVADCPLPNVSPQGGSIGGRHKRKSRQS